MIKEKIKGIREYLEEKQAYSSLGHLHTLVDPSYVGKLFGGYIFTNFYNSVISKIDEYDCNNGKCRLIREGTLHKHLTVKDEFDKEYKCDDVSCKTTREGLSHNHHTRTAEFCVDENGKVLQAEGNRELVDYLKWRSDIYDVIGRDKDGLTDRLEVYPEMVVMGLTAAIGGLGAL